VGQRANYYVDGRISDDIDAHVRAAESTHRLCVPTFFYFLHSYFQIELNSIQFNHTLYINILYKFKFSQMPSANIN